MADQSVETVPEPRSIAGFWRRVGALVLDTLLLMAVLAVVGKLFFDLLAARPGFDRAFGFFIVVGYFAVCDSRLFGGQTLGKRWLGIRVAGAGGQPIGVGRAVLRTLVLFGPSMAGDVDLPFLRSASPSVVSVVSILLIGVQVGMPVAGLSLFVFDTKTRRSLHDLVAGTFVIAAKAAAPSPRRAAPLPRYIAGGLAAVAVVAGAAVIWGPLQSRATQGADYALLQSLVARREVAGARVSQNWHEKLGESPVRYTLVSTRISKRPRDWEDEKAAIKLEVMHYPQLLTGDRLVVQLIYGMDLFLFHWFVTDVSQYPVAKDGNGSEHTDILRSHPSRVP